MKYLVYRLISVMIMFELARTTDSMYMRILFIIGFVMYGMTFIKDAYNFVKEYFENRKKICLKKK